MTSRGRAESGGVKLAWEATGEGDVILVIHGLGYERHGWGPAIEVLAARFRIIAFDNRGVGETDAPEGPYSAAQMADDAAAVLDDAGVARVHVVGTSLGGMIAQELALNHPARVETLMLSATTPGGEEAFPMPQRGIDRFAAFAANPSPATLRGLVENSLADSTVTTRPELVEEILRYRLANPVELEPWLAQAAAGSAFSSLSRLPGLERPTLVTHGTSDNVVDYRNSELLARAIPNAELMLMADTGHLAFWERPTEFADTVADFCDRRGTR